MITIIDYGLGNILAFANVYKRLNIPFSVARTSEDLKGAMRIILPGVGAFDYAMKRLDNSGMRSALDDLVLGQRVPVVGVCVGMQILAKESEEGSLPGLGWIDATVKKFIFEKQQQSRQLPHMGWNDVRSVKSNNLFRNLELDSRFYFLHSYYFSCMDSEDTLAESEYGIKFSCAINRDNIYGVQFHPEKSHGFGAQLLKNFSDI